MLSESYNLKRQEKLSVQVAERLKDWIVEGKLKEGDRIPPERELCEAFDVSRTVIREAISVLGAKGLVSSRTGSGSYVRCIRSEDVADSLTFYIAAQSQSVPLGQLLEVRRVIESQAAGLAAERASDEAVSELETILSSMCERVGDPEAFAEKDLEFHLALARASGNPLFATILEPLTDAMLQLILVGSHLPGTPEEACAYHGAVLEAVRSKDAALAVQTMMGHLEQTKRVTVKGLSARSEEGI